LALVFRGIFIALGAAAINRFTWVFFLFGAFLIYTAIKLVMDYRKHEDESDELPDNAAMRMVKRRFPATDDYRGTRLTVIEDGKRLITPMLFVIVALGSTDLMFALDSIPAIFGLTQNVYVVFTATAFSLLGLRQLFFLLDGLLDRLIYLSFGLAAILAFIGAKLILHALHENNLPFVNSGEHVEVAEISTGLSLIVILAVLLITILASLFSTRGRTQTAMAHIRRDATAYLNPDYTDDPAERERVFQRLLRARDHITELGPKAKQQVRNEADLMDLCRQVGEAHAAAHSDHPIRPSL
jgi:tellurite resistance protein TerC